MKSPYAVMREGFSVMFVMGVSSKKAGVLAGTPAFVLRTANNLICRGARLKL